LNSVRKERPKQSMKEEQFQKEKNVSHGYRVAILATHITIAKLIFLTLMATVLPRLDRG
jgi:hypothetical protein